MQPIDKHKTIVDLIKNTIFPKTNSDFYKFIFDKKQLNEFLLGNNLVKTSGVCNNILCKDKEPNMYVAICGND